MILFDTNKANVKWLKKAMKKQGHDVTISIYHNEEDCVEALEKSDITSMLWIGADAEYLINWIISMQPSIRRIIIYHDHNVQSILQKLRRAQYTAEHIPYTLLQERLQ